MSSLTFFVSHLWQRSPQHSSFFVSGHTPHLLKTSFMFICVSLESFLQETLFFTFLAAFFLLLSMLLHGCIMYLDHSLKLETQESSGIVNDNIDICLNCWRIKKNHKMTSVSVTEACVTLIRNYLDIWKIITLDLSSFSYDPC